MPKPDVPEIFNRALLSQRRERLTALHPRGRWPTFLLEHAVDNLMERLAFVCREFEDLLVVGALEGSLGRRLQSAMSPRLLVEVDHCDGMLRHCDGMKVLGDEACLPFGSERFDLVVSALALQFVNDLPGALAQIRHVLRPDGLFLGVIAGGATLTELRQCMLDAEAELLGGASPRVAPFADVRDAGALLQRAGFALPVADTETLTVTYGSALELMRELKLMGASNVLVERTRKPMTRGLLLRAAEIYGERFSDADGRIAATFEFLTLTGWAPHESQQKPMRPGSAAARLADALGVPETAAGEKVPGRAENEGSTE